jgi:hypothetical protein
LQDEKKRRLAMPIPALRAPQAFAGDKPGPFAAGTGRDLRILVDLPAGQRQVDDSTKSSDTLGVPEPSRLLWTLGQRDDIAMYWMAEPDQAEAAGAVCLHEPDRGGDQLDFTTTDMNGSRWMQGVWPYRQWEDLAARSVPAGTSASNWRRDVIVARVAVVMRVDLLVTASMPLLDSALAWITAANPMTAESALAVVGLYLRGRRQYPMLAPDLLCFGEHLLLWSAARAQLPSGCRWGSALVAHSRAVQRDGPMFLFQSLHERMVRLLRCRDRVHAALLVPQNNQTAGEVTEALDYFMVNLVGAFDAAARAAHLAVGLSPSSRRSAAWHHDTWRSRVRTVSPDLADLFAPGTEHSRVLEICRILRNTVHGEAMHTTAVHAGGRPLQTLVALPEDDAEDVAELFDSLGGQDEWGLHRLAPSRVHVDAARLIERLLPHALQVLDDALRLTPVERLDGVLTSLTTSPPEDRSFGLGTRTRASLLLGLPVPTV